MAVPPVSAGSVLAGKYRVERVLGEGGMGIVVAATDLTLERKVAIKFLLPDFSKHEEAAQRFLREARSSVKIQSDHVARVIDVGTLESGSPYMVMEYLEGRDLSAVIEEHRTLPVEEAVGYVLEACDAIAEAHSVGIVHRDLKPANLFLTRQPDGTSRVKVLDFGISKAMVTESDHSLTRTSSMMGSPLYMSPEQMKSAKNVDPRTDVWALGVILYELLMGEPPFNAESIPELSAKVLLDLPKPIRSVRKDVPQGVEAAVMRALEKEPANRFPTVADFAVALGSFGPARTRVNVERATRVQRIQPGPVRTAEPTTAADAPVSSVSAPSYARTEAAWTDTGSKTSEKRRTPLVFGGIAAVVVAGAVAFALTRGSGRNEAASTPSSAPASPGVAAAAAPATPSVAAEPSTRAPPSVAAPAASIRSPEPAVMPSVGGVPATKPALGTHAKSVKKSKPEPAAAPTAVDPTSAFGSRK